MLALPETKSFISGLEAIDQQNSEASQKSIANALRGSVIELWDALKELDDQAGQRESLAASISICFEQIWEQVRYHEESLGFSKESEADRQSILSYDEIQSSSDNEKTNSFKDSEYEHALHLMNQVDKKKNRRPKQKSHNNACINATVQDEERINQDFDSNWHLKGEASAHQRPKNSLLSHNFEMDYALKSPPKPSLESTEALEKHIKHRITSKTFDDPKRNQIYSNPADLIISHKKDDEDSKRSTKSLTEIYDKTIQNVQSDDTKISQEAQEELKCLNMWRTILGYLDSISSHKSVPQPFIENTFEILRNSGISSTTGGTDKHSSLSKSSFIARDEMTSFEKKRSRRKEKNIRRDSKK